MSLCKIFLFSQSFSSLSVHEREVNHLFKIIFIFFRMKIGSEKEFFLLNEQDYNKEGIPRPNGVRMPFLNIEYGKKFTVSKRDS